MGRELSPDQVEVIPTTNDVKGGERTDVGVLARSRIRPKRTFIETPTRAEHAAGAIVKRTNSEHLLHARRGIGGAGASVGSLSNLCVS